MVDMYLMKLIRLLILRFLVWMLLCFTDNSHDDHSSMVCLENTTDERKDFEDIALYPIKKSDINILSDFL